MYCKYCGKLVENNSKFCKYCGKKLDNALLSEQRLNIDDRIHEKSDLITNEYVNDSSEAENTEFKKQLIDEINKNSPHAFFNFIPLKYRNKVDEIATWIDKVVEFIVGLILLDFIYQQVQLDEGYKLIVYVVRFIQYAAIPDFWAWLISELVKFIRLRDADIKPGNEKKTIVGLSIVAGVLYLYACYYFATPSDGILLGLTKAMFYDSFLEAFIEVLFAYKTAMVLLMIAMVLNAYRDKKLIEKEDTKEKKD